MDETTFYRDDDWYAAGSQIERIVLHRGGLFRWRWLDAPRGSPLWRATFWTRAAAERAARDAGFHLYDNAGWLAVPGDASFGLREMQ